MTIISLATGIIILVFWLPLEILNSTHAQIFAFASTYGFWSGAFISMLLPCVAELGPISSLGQRFGTFEAIVSIG